MSRRQARECAMQTLCSLDLTGELGSDSGERRADTLALAREEAKGITAEDVAYAEELLGGIQKNLAVIDDLLASASRDWKISRMPTADRNIVRLAVFEMYFLEPRLKPSIAVNEAVELAKIYGTDDSSRFIHGILRTVTKRLGLRQK